MTNVQDEPRGIEKSVKSDFDAVIIGAGFSGMYMLHSLRDKLDLKVTVFEAGDGVGGTWYWNRYPGARCDSDSYIYCYTFDKNLLQEWELVRALSAAGRDPALPRALCRALRPQARHPVRQARRRSRLRRQLRALDGAHRQRRRRSGRASSLPRSARCRPPTCRRSRGSVLSRASVTTPASGRTTASISPPSASASSARAPPPCRRSLRSRNRPST